jgi:hypothetical protein
MKKPEFYQQWLTKKVDNIVDPIHDYISLEAVEELKEVFYRDDEYTMDWCKKHLNGIYRKKIDSAYRKHVSREKNSIADSIELDHEHSLVLTEIAKYYKITKREMVRKLIKEEAKLVTEKQWRVEYRPSVS